MRNGMGRLLALALVGTAGVTGAQETRGTDARLYPLLGCWRSDSTGARTTRSTGLTCVTPVEGSADVEIFGIVDGRVSSRRRVSANPTPHAIDGQGCTGRERTMWSVLPRRIYLRSEYVCTGTGIAGGSSTLFSFLPSGEWLEVEGVHSGGGTVVRVERRRDAGVPGSLPREVAGRVGGQRLAVMTARAEAATPIRSEEVLEAIRATDTAVVRAWLLESQQYFRLNGDEVSTLVRNAVPAEILQAMMSTPPQYQLGVGVDANGRSTDEYLSTPGWAPAYVYSPWSYPYAYEYGYHCCYPYRRVVYENVYVFAPSPVYPAYRSRPGAPRGYAGYTGYTPYSQSYYYTPSPYYAGGAHYPSSTPYRPVQPQPAYLTNPVGVRPPAVAPRPAASPAGPSGRRP